MVIKLKARCINRYAATTGSLNTETDSTSFCDAVTKLDVTRFCADTTKTFNGVNAVRTSMLTGD